MARIRKIKEIKLVPRIGKIISLELSAKQKGIQHGKNRMGRILITKATKFT